MGLQVTCPNCGSQLPVPTESVGKKIRCGICQTVIAVSAGTGTSVPLELPPTPRPHTTLPPVTRPAPVTLRTQPRPGRSSHKRSDQTASDRALLWSLVGVFTLLVVPVAVVLVVQLASESDQPLAELTEAEPEPEAGQTSGPIETNDPDAARAPAQTIAVLPFPDSPGGYTFQIPAGFTPLDRAEKRGGEVCYTFRSETDTAAGAEFCVSPDRNSTRDTTPPVVFSAAPSNFRAPIVQINGMYYFPKERTRLIRIDGMSAVEHRIDFSLELNNQQIHTKGWFVHAMDDGWVVTMRILTTKQMPSSQWHAAVTSIRSVANVDPDQIPEAFR